MSPRKRKTTDSNDDRLQPSPKTYKFSHSVSDTQRRSSNNDNKNLVTKLIDALQLFFHGLKQTIEEIHETCEDLDKRVTVLEKVKKKNLPEFCGNSLDWPLFKETYEESSEYFSDVENRSRIAAALKGEAQEMVYPLLATSSSPRCIMYNLDKHYGNKHTLAKKMIDNLKSLPRLQPGDANLMRFSLQLQSTMNALINLNLQEYLDSQQTFEVVRSKLSLDLKEAYSKYLSTLTLSYPPLLQLSIFLYERANPDKLQRNKSSKSLDVTREEVRSEHLHDDDRI